MNRLIRPAVLLLTLLGCDPWQAQAVGRRVSALQDALQAGLVLDAGIVRVECRVDASGPGCRLEPARIRPVVAPRQQARAPRAAATGARSTSIQ